MFDQKGLAPILIVILIVAALVGYLVYSGKINLPQKINDQQITETSKVDETANWKTYTNSEYGFSFRYPPTLELISLDNKFSLKTEPGTELGTEIIRASITNKKQDFINDLQYESCDKILSNKYSTGLVCVHDIKKISLGVILGKIFKYNEIGSGGGVATIIQTIQEPFTQFKFSFAIDSKADGPAIFDQILPTFKFIDQNQISGNKTSPNGSFIVTEEAQGDYKAIAIKDKNGTVVTNDLIKLNSNVISDNMRKLGLTGAGQIGYHFKEWVSDKTFKLSILVANGWEFETLVEAKTGKVDESSFKRIK